MKLRYKGCLKTPMDLPISNVPVNSKKFKEPSSTLAVNIVMILYLIPVLIIIKGVTSLVLSFNNEIDIKFSMAGFYLALLISVPHEILHAICFPRKAEVYCYIIPKSFMLAVTCIEPITKLNYIWMNLCPNLFLGWVPLIVWCFIPNIPNISNILFSYTIISICMGCGDYMNIVNACIQMPKNSYQQLSGFNSYWFLKNDKQTN